MAEMQNPQPVPVRQTVLKLDGRCNIACDYCYVYEMQDTGWQHRKMSMAPETIAWAAHRMGEHATAHGLRQLEFVFHGGEPLLIGAHGIAKAAQLIRRYVPEDISIKYTMQTNGILLDRPTLDVLDDHNVHVGVSLDGAEPDNDRHRKYANGKGTFQKVAQGIQLLQTEYSHLFAGLICTVNLENNPKETFHALASFKPPTIDFLLPHGNWRNPPPGYDPNPQCAETPYADWLITAFDLSRDKKNYRGYIRLFDSIIALWEGRQSTTQTFGLGAQVTTVVQPEGAYELDDKLESAYDGAAATGYNVYQHDLDTVLTHPGMRARQLGLRALSQTCQNCNLVRVCGGGDYVHRYAEATGFENPSVFCRDNQKLLLHVKEALDATFEQQKAQAIARHPFERYYRL